mgnify:CR=1 FL=1
MSTPRAAGVTPKLTFLTPSAVNTPGTAAVISRMPSMVSGFVGSGSGRSGFGVGSGFGGLSGFGGSDFGAGFGFERRHYTDEQSSCRRDGCNTD